MQKSKKSRKQTKTYKTIFLKIFTSLEIYGLQPRVVEYCFFSVFCFFFFLFAFLMSKTSGILFFCKFCLAVFFWVFSSFLNFCMFDVQEFGNIGHLRLFSKFFGFCMFSSMECFQDFWNVLFWSFLKSLYVSWCFVDGFNWHSYEICHKHVFSLCFCDSLFASIEMKCTFEAEVRSSLSRHMCDKDLNDRRSKETTEIQNNWTKWWGKMKRINFYKMILQSIPEYDYAKRYINEHFKRIS